MLYVMYLHTCVCACVYIGSMHTVHHVHTVCTVKPVYKDHSRDQEEVSSVDRWFYAVMLYCS